MTFISPLKMRAAFGPDSEQTDSDKFDISLSLQSSQDLGTIKTCPGSPLPS